MIILKNYLIVKKTENLKKKTKTRHDGNEEEHRREAGRAATELEDRVAHAPEGR